MTATTTDTGAALLRAVLADPASDDARLIYADYLDEQGEADRAEFIRVQCELTRVRAWSPGHNGGTSTSPRGVMPVWRERVGELRQRERELWAGQAGVRICQDGLRDRLEPRLVPLTDPTPPQCIYRRGFVAEIRLPLAAYLAHARDLFGRHPITAVHLTDRGPILWAAGRWGWDWDREWNRDEGGTSDWNRVLFGLAEASDPAGVMNWPTPEDARRVLSGYLVNCGRKLADLPPLE